MMPTTQTDMEVLRILSIIITFKAPQALGIELDWPVAQIAWLLANKQELETLCTALAALLEAFANALA